MSTAGMGYEEHPELATPADETRIWRYMSFSKWIAMLETHALHFTPLSAFSDELEGRLSEKNAQIERVSELPPDIFERLKALAERTRTMTFANCWYQNDFESTAMWDLYGPVDGIAIQSTVGRLKYALHVDPLPIYISGIKYIDYKNDLIPETNLLHFGTHKRKEYAHENEVRAILLNDILTDRPRGVISSGGFDVVVDMSELCERFVLAPKASSWFKRLAVVLGAKYGVSCPIVQSNLDLRIESLR